MPTKSQIARDLEALAQIALLSEQALTDAGVNPSRVGDAMAPMIALAGAEYFSMRTEYFEPVPDVPPTQGGGTY